MACLPYETGPHDTRPGRGDIREVHSPIRIGPLNDPEPAFNSTHRNEVAAEYFVVPTLMHDVLRPASGPDERDDSPIRESCGTSNDRAARCFAGRSVFSLMNGFQTPVVLVDSELIGRPGRYVDDVPRHGIPKHGITCGNARRGGTRLNVFGCIRPYRFRVQRYAVKTRSVSFPRSRYEKRSLVTYRHVTHDNGGED